MRARKRGRRRSARIVVQRLGACRQADRGLGIGRLQADAVIVRGVGVVHANRARGAGAQAHDAIVVKLPTPAAKTHGAEQQSSGGGPVSLEIPRQDTLHREHRGKTSRLAAPNCTV